MEPKRGANDVTRRMERIFIALSPVHQSETSGAAVAPRALLTTCHDGGAFWIFSSCAAPEEHLLHFAPKCKNAEI